MLQQVTRDINTDSVKGPAKIFFTPKSSMSWDYKGKRAERGDTITSMETHKNGEIGFSVNKKLGAATPKHTKPPSQCPRPHYSTDCAFAITCFQIPFHTVLSHRFVWSFPASPPCLLSSGSSDRAVGVF